MCKDLGYNWEVENMVPCYAFASLWNKNYWDDKININKGNQRQWTPPSNYLWDTEIQLSFLFFFLNFSFLYILFQYFSQGFTSYSQLQRSLYSHKENIDEGSGRLEFQSQLYHWVTAIPQSIHFPPLRGGLSIHKNQWIRLYQSFIK